MLPTSPSFDFAELHAYFDSEQYQNEQKKRQAMIAAARRFYDGDHARPLSIAPGQPDDNVIINLCRALIDDAAAWLIAGLEIDTGANGAADDVVKRLLATRKFLSKMALRGGIAGHVFVQLLVRDGKAIPLVLDPSVVGIKADRDDDESVSAYCSEWVETMVVGGRKSEYLSRRLFARFGETWVAGEFQASLRKRKREWETLRVDVWPYAWSPIHDCPNVPPAWGYYGLSDLEDVAGINESINFLASNTQRILKFHAHPKTVGTGFTTSDVQATAVDGFWTVPSDTAKIYNLEMQSDLSSSLNFFDALRTAFWTIGRGLDPSVYKDKIGQITNFALRVLAARALKKTEQKRREYGEMLHNLILHALEVENVPVQNVQVKFGDPLPEDVMLALQAMRLEHELGTVSLQTLAIESGRDWAQEQARIEEEQRADGNIGLSLLKEFDRGGGMFGANQ